jgi:hypothetical protein
MWYGAIEFRNAYWIKGTDRLFTDSLEDFKTVHWLSVVVEVP